MSAAEWTAFDAPVVGPMTDAAFACLTCRAWSQWIGDAGDCLFHAYKRREEMIAGATERTPEKSARMTAAEETCDGWTGIGR